MKETIDRSYQWEDGLMRFAHEHSFFAGAMTDDQSLLYYDKSVTLPHPFPVMLSVDDMNSMMTLVNPGLFGFDVQHPLVEIKKNLRSHDSAEIHYEHEYDEDGYVKHTVAKVLLEDDVYKIDLVFYWR